ncbi:aminoacyl-tRNA hydrolase [Sulfurimonas sp. SAG-AH-194-I05]|nr:aminoacyl-tRNA hydrolase [Sulfurimonas sp. SAG-AH-194-I05]MDF1875803.1 aminoacyl-tRNA hydrolase [Sulfurimonas sp. SAG-AH-194-I05]
MLIVGLGNPGSEYENTRHNIGFMLIDELIRRKNAQTLSSSSFEGTLFKFQNHFLLKPLTFMNLSGNSIAKVKKFYKVEDVVVIHDDLDLPFGTLRFKHGGGHGGHNGLRSTDEKISKEYTRVRMGIGKPEHKGEVASYVLSAFNKEESEHVPAWIEKTCEAVEFLLENSMENTSSKYTIKKFKLQ